MSRTFANALVFAAVVAAGSGVAYEWQTPCGTSKTSMKTCVERKGDVVSLRRGDKEDDCADSQMVMTH